MMLWESSPALWIVRAAPGRNSKRRVDFPGFSEAKRLAEMAEPTHVGTVFVFGLDGTLAFAAPAMLATENEPQRMSFADQISRHNSKSKKGETIGVQLYDPNPKITIVTMPRATNPGAGAIADAKLNVILPTKGSQVTLAGFPPLGGAEDSINSVKWIYLGDGSIEFTNDAEVVMTLPLEKFNTDLVVAT